MSDKKRDVCCNCGREIFGEEHFGEMYWYHFSDRGTACDPTQQMVFPVSPREMMKKLANPRDKRWESVYVVTERVMDKVEGEELEHTFISIQLVFYGIQLSQDFHLHPDNEGEKYHWIEKGVEAMDEYLDEAGIKR